MADTIAHRGLKRLAGWSWGRAARLLAGLFVVLAVAYAPEASAQGTRFAPGYKISDGDVLRVDASGRQDISGQYPVSSDGTIVLPVVGSVRAKGRTAVELATEISRRLSLLSRDIPQVSVTVLESRAQKTFVLGSVLLPGAYTFAEPPTVWEAINEAGGPAADADLSRVEILRGTTGSTTVDVAAAIRSGNLAGLDRVRPGDTVRVPRGTGLGGTAGGEDFVYVFGAVATQGAVPAAAAPDLVTATIRCGGPTVDADLSEVEIVRRNGLQAHRFRVNLRDYMNKAVVAGNPTLQAGDTVYFPRERRSSILTMIGTVSPVLTFLTSIFFLID